MITLNNKRDTSKIIYINVYTDSFNSMNLDSILILLILNVDFLFQLNKITKTGVKYCLCNQISDEEHKVL